MLSLCPLIRAVPQGHKLASGYGGILHRDVSSGNILIVDRPIPEHPDCKGVLHDFDYSSMTATAPSGDIQSSSSEAPPLHRLEVDEEDAEDEERSEIHSHCCCLDGVIGQLHKQVKSLQAYQRQPQETVGAS